MLHRYQLGRAAVLAVSLLLAAPAIAAADGGGYGFSVGPVKVHHGYSATASGGGCNTAHAGASVGFTKTKKAWTEMHTYFGTHGTKTTCHVASNLSTGKLSFTIGNLVAIKVKFHRLGAIKKGPLPKGCSGPKPETATGTAKGTVRIKISSKYFGTFKASKTKATVTKVLYTCKEGTPPSNNSISLSAFTAHAGLFAVHPSKGASTVSFFTSAPVNKAVVGSHSIFLTGGSSLFSAASNLSSATINGTGPLTGQLKFTANKSCKGTTRTGTLSGKLTAHIDSLGTRALGPGTSATLFKGTGGTPCT